jgi:hypothetical protein
MASLAIREKPQHPMKPPELPGDFNDTRYRIMRIAKVRKGCIFVDETR